MLWAWNLSDNVDTGPCSFLPFLPHLLDAAAHLVVSEKNLVFGESLEVLVNVFMYMTTLNPWKQHCEVATSLYKKTKPEEIRYLAQVLHLEPGRNQIQFLWV